MRYKAGDVVKIDKTRFVIERVTKKGYILFPHIGFFVKDCRINKKIKVKKSYELGDKFKCLCDFSSGTSVVKKDKHYICTQKFSDGTYMLTRIKNKEEKLRVNTNQIHAYFRHYFGGWE